MNRIAQTTTLGFLSRSSGIAIALLAAAATRLPAQEIVSATTQDAIVPEALRQVQQAENPIINQSTPAARPDTPLVISGPFTVRAHLTYRFVEADGLPDPNGNDRSSGINNFSPDIFVDLGRHWVFDYMPTFTYYTNSAFRNSVDQSLRLSGWATYEDWTVQTANHFDTTTSPDVQIGQQARQTNWSNNVDALYSINSALGLELGLSHAFQSAQEFASSHEYSTADWLHYKAAPRIDMAVGMSYGYVDMSAGTDMTYFRPQVQMTWAVLNKISLAAHAGEESRHFRDGSAANANNPIYGASLQWQPIETTSVTLGVDHAVATTFFQNVVTKATQLSARVNQQLFRNFYFSASIQKTKNDYEAPLGSLVTVRNDDTTTYDLRLTTDVFGRCSLAAFFDDTHNSSDIAQFGVSSRQFGIEAGYRF